MLLSLAVVVRRAAVGADDAGAAAVRRGGPLRDGRLPR